MTEARLIPVRVPDAPVGVVLVLHGGAGRHRSMMVRPTQLSVLRMIPIARRIARGGRGRLAVFRLLNSSRGWDTRRTPVDDVGWALRRVDEQFGALPVCLVGHSLGGRAALLAATSDAVVSAVALNPYLYPQDGQVGLSGKQVLIVHGTSDRIARIEVAEAVARQLSRRNHVVLEPVPGGKHAMLSHHEAFDHRAAEFTIASLLEPGAVRHEDIGD